jgi:hypothetical protein
MMLTARHALAVAPRADERAFESSRPSVTGDWLDRDRGGRQDIFRLIKVVAGGVAARGAQSVVAIQL